MLEQGESWADRQTGINFLPAESHSRLLIPQDTNSRLCFTFTSNCRGRERQQKLSAISDFSLFLSAFSYKLSLSCPLLSVCLYRSHSVSLSLLLSRSLSLSLLSSFHELSLSLLPSPPPSSTRLWSFQRLCWDFLSSAALFSFNSTSEVYM